MLCRTKGSLVHTATSNLPQHGSIAISHFTNYFLMQHKRTVQGIGGHLWEFERWCPSIDLDELILPDLSRERERDLQLLASYWTSWCQDMRMHHRKSCLKTWFMIGARRQLFAMYTKARTDIDVCDIPFLLKSIVGVQISNYFKDSMNIYC